MVSPKDRILQALREAKRRRVFGVHEDFNLIGFDWVRHPITVLAEMQNIAPAPTRIAPTMPTVVTAQLALQMIKV